MIDPVVQTDEDLAREAQEDKSRFLPLYDRYARRLERYVIANVASRQDAEDIVSTAFLQALARISTFDPARGSFAAWLFAIARNLVNMHHRRPIDTTADVFPEVIDDAESPQEALVRRERVEALRAAVQRLSPDHRDVLTLRYLAELPFADIAAQLGTTEGAAKMRVKRALGALGRELQWHETE